CCALGALTLVPLLSLFRRGAWEAPCLVMLIVALGVGSAVPAELRARRAARPLRAGASALLALALVTSGLMVTSSVFEARRGFTLLESTAELTHAADAPGETENAGEEAAPLEALVAIVTDGANQLAGAQTDAESEAWDLVIVLGGTAVSAVAALLAGSRELRCCTALIPLGIAVADQLVMGAVRPVWTAAVVALGLLLARGAGRPSRGALRLGVVVLLACGLAASGSAIAWGAGATESRLGQGDEGGSVPAAEQSDVPRIETLVDLSANLTRNSSTVALTYTTSVGRPLYLRLGVLDRFDGSEWRFSDKGSALYEEVNWSLYDGIIGYARGEGTTFVTTIWTDGDAVPAPPGTRAVRSLDERTYVMNGTYVEPLRDATEADVFVQSLEQIRGSGAPVDLTGGDHAAELEVFGSVPESVSAVVEAARADGIEGSDYVGRAEAVRWLMAYFSSEDFTYSAAAPGGDGKDNLSAIGDFLTQKRGYCTHYATAFTVLARLLGVPARVVMGYMPSDATDESGNYEVTMRQLHSWSEVWIDGIGWVGVDVTPAATSEGVAVDDLPTEPQVQPDESPVDETPQVPEADAPEPPDEQDGQEPSAGENEACQDVSELPGWVAPLGGAVLAAGVGALAVLLARRARLARLRRGDWDYAWRRVCRTARRARLSWGPEATEKDVAEVICNTLSDEGLARAVRHVARNACLTRYGSGAPATGAEKLPDLLARLKGALRQK
ncbi:transglutaminaseTgpA domain-containing protein, partial [Thermophilibacter provencensis]